MPFSCFTSSHRFSESTLSPQPRYNTFLKIHPSRMERKSRPLPYLLSNVPAELKPGCKPGISARADCPRARISARGNLFSKVVLYSCHDCIKNGLFCQRLLIDHSLTKQPSLDNDHLCPRNDKEYLRGPKSPG